MCIFPVFGVLLGKNNEKLEFEGEFCLFGGCFGFFVIVLEMLVKYKKC